MSKAKSKTLHLDHHLHHRSFLLFALFFVFVLWAFWSSYYSILTQEMPVAIRFHGTTMTLWCLMLIGQSVLIRYRKYFIHRWIGRLSYVLVPLIVFSGAHLAHLTIAQLNPGQPFTAYLAALMFNSLIVFIVLYGLAMYHRKKSSVHARYMLCTIFPLISPVTDRIIYKYIDSLVPHAPHLLGMPIVPVYGYAIVDLILIGLIIWDWRTHKKLNVFPFVLGLLLIYHASVLYFHSFGWWQSISEWIMSLPLS